MMSGAVQYDCEYLTVEAIAGDLRLVMRCGGYYPASMSAVPGGHELPLTLYAPAAETARAAEPAILERVRTRGYRKAD